jgi:ABC-type ATPase involved in cell division
VIVWDSPISEVDSHWTDYEISLIKDFKDRGVTQILLSNRKIIESLGHHVYRLEKGQCNAA